jgi:hypothetical protein
MTAEKFILITLVAGLIGTLGMAGLLIAITKSGIANADMVRAIGSLFTKSLGSSFRVGILADILVGIIFAAFYIFVVVSFEVQGLLSCIGVSMLISFIHGAVISFLLIGAVAKHHPVKQFQEVGFSVAIVHWAGHLFYGFLVGLIIGFMGT